MKELAIEFEESLHPTNLPIQIDSALLVVNNDSQVLHISVFPVRHVLPSRQANQTEIINSST